MQSSRMARKPHAFDPTTAKESLVRRDERISGIDLTDIGMGFWTWDHLDKYLSSNPSTSTAPITYDATVQQLRGSQTATPFHIDAVSAASLNIPHSMNVLTRSFIKRTPLTLEKRGIMSLILNTMRSYPMMLARDWGLPPFIHHTTTSGNDAGEPLSNCMTLLRLLEGNTRGGGGGSQLFWRNVETECSTWCQQVCSAFQIHTILDENTNHTSLPHSTTITSFRPCRRLQSTL